MDLPYLVFKRNEFYDTDTVLQFLRGRQIDYLILAGFLWLIPDNLIQTYSDRIINVHPSLLPKYGGKGMYGMHVHRAVKDQGDSYSGITIHLVNEEYDKGRVLLQTKTKLDPSDTPEVIAGKVLKLEHHFFPRVVAAYCK
jgi:phosphoribosylglycinamide formyltransferase-1